MTSRFLSSEATIGVGSLAYSEETLLSHFICSLGVYEAFLSLKTSAFIGFGGRRSERFSPAMGGYFLGDIHRLGMVQAEVGRGHLSVFGGNYTADWVVYCLFIV